jgi:hypothetical protein
MAMPTLDTWVEKKYPSIKQPFDVSGTAAHMCEHFLVDLNQVIPCKA